MKEERFFRNTDTVLAIAVIGLILLLIVPLPPFLLDLFLCFSIVFSVMSLLLTLFIEHPLEFSAFPSLLLFLTLYRLGLNIASTRMILADGKAGAIIRSFGEYVTCGNVAVGLILFVLLALINFIVVTKGAGRIAEVAARFILEALPGKQAAVDAELSSGALSHKEATAARAKIQEEAEFYGAMDGASKFVKGDAICGLVITCVNIVGGLIIGITVKHLSLHECLTTYLILTVGDGLISAIPALLISVSAGIMVTASSSHSLSTTLIDQVVRHRKVLFLTAALMVVIGLLPGMPFFVMLPISIGLTFLGFRASKSKQQTRKEQKEEGDAPFFIPYVEVEVGLKSLRLIPEMQERIASVREGLIKRLGLILPSVHFSDGLKLSSGSYVIKIKGIKVGEGEVFKGELSSFEKRFTSLVMQHAATLLNRQAVAQLVESAKTLDSAVVAELIPKKVGLGQILKVLQNLLSEGIPIRDFISILELIADKVPEKTHVDTDLLTEHVRGGLSHAISAHFFGEKRCIYAITLDAKVEKMIAASISKSDPQNGMLLSPKTQNKIIAALKDLVDKSVEPAVVLTSLSTRRHLRRLIAHKLPAVPVLAYSEVTLDLATKSVGVVPIDVLSY